MGKRILEGSTPTERANKRRSLGTLRQLTVQPSTKARYQKAIDTFLSFLHTNSLALPSKRENLDPLVCDFLESLWANGQGRALGSDCVAGLQDMDPKIRGHLHGAWRLLKTWAVNEVPNRAPPIPEHLLHSMCGWACFNGHFAFAVSLLIGFYGMLRTGELLGCRRGHFLAESSGRRVVLSLGLTKGGKRTGAAESVILAHDMLLPSLLHWMRKAKSGDPLTASPGKWRKLFNDSLAALQVTSFGFRPYSLRRGGATWWFSRHHSLDRILLQGRWQAAKTARVYINEGLAVLAELQLPLKDPRLLPYLTVFRSHLLKPSFTTLEPPSGRAGGRGRGSNRRQKPVVSKRRWVDLLSFWVNLPLSLFRVEVWLILSKVAKWDW